jgi:uncharacterized protein YbbC (DUF1343 family)
MKISRVLQVWSVLSCVGLQAAPLVPKVELGIDVLAAKDFAVLQGKRVGLITNPTGVNKFGQSTVDLLRNARNVKLVALYGPEHGVYGMDYAGDDVASAKDKITGLPVFSLYGPTRKPTQDMLKGVDVLVYDIQDIGCRSYTFISTMGLAMEAAGEAGIEFVVLDRPNPLNGRRFEGMPLDPKWRSFVGQWEIPYVYGLTCGELAQMIVGEKWIKAAPKLTVITMKGWTRGMDWSDTGLIWVPTSPHIPTAETAYGYVLTGLMGDLEIVCHGVGYTLPFGLIGHESFDGVAMAAELNAKNWPGLWFRPAAFKPFYGTFKDKVLKGVQWHLMDPSKLNLCNTAVRLLDDLRTRVKEPLFGKAAKDKIELFDKLCGGPDLRLHMSQGKPVEDLIQSWQPSLDTFQIKRVPYLLYADENAISVTGKSEFRIPKSETNSN